jgi:phosphoribosylglycinamide formyltransferase-1
MYGMNVHKPLLIRKRNHNIHYVNENYDEGGVVFQKKVILSGSNARRHR